MRIKPESTSTAAPGIPDNGGVRVSILMLAFNRPHLIGRAIRSILAQDYKELEVIVVHDGPDDRIEAIVREWVHRDDRIRYFRREKPGNIANALNFGLVQARGEYIAILDDDDHWLTSQKLGWQVTFLDRNQDYVGCGGGMVVADQTGRELMRYFKPRDDEDIKRLALVANPMAHGTSMFRREVAGRLSLYDETLPGFQDWDLWLTLGRTGKLHNLQELFTGYTLWRGSSSFYRHRDNARAALRIVLRHRIAYAHFPLALTLALLHYLYAYCPALIRDGSFFFLARLKKAIFSHQKERDASTGIAGSSDSLSRL